MNVYATVVIANADKAEAQSLTSDNLFTTEFRKGFKKYWVSSGEFTEEHYNALVDSGLIFHLIDLKIKPSKVLTALGFNKVVVEED